MSKISDERLAQLNANASGAADETWWLDDVADALTELQSLRSQPAGVRVKGIDPRLYHLHVEALAEIKATVDGKSDQPVINIIYGLLDEIRALPEIAALEPQQEEAVAWAIKGPDAYYSVTSDEERADIWRNEFGAHITPLYAHPAPVQKVQESQTVSEALAYAVKGLNMVHDGLMDPTRPRQAVGEVCAHFLEAGRSALHSIKED